VRRTQDELAKMRKAGRVVAEMHAKTREAIRPGITTMDLDRIARDVIEQRGARSNFLNYHGFPAVICTSPNDMIVHGIPSETVVLNEGDIISIDCGAIIEGYHGDAAYTAGVGRISAEAEKLLEVTERSLFKAVEQCLPGNRLGDVSNAVQTTVESEGLSVVRSLVGHGIGRSMHEEPQIPNYGPAGKGIVLEEGMVLAIEPMVTAGRHMVRMGDDGWAIYSQDGSLAAHFEFTVAITAKGPRILTPWHESGQRAAA